jgi:hypothetical protein
MLSAKPEGNYHYLPITIESEPQDWEVPFCCGVVADAGYEIVRATFERPVPWRDGFTLIDSHLKALRRPCQALCGIELLCAAPYTREGFLEFNGKYAEVLIKWGLYGNKVGTGSTARTNIAPSYGAPEEQVMAAFAYTVPSSTRRPTFVVSSGTPGGVRLGEKTADAIREQVAWMVNSLEQRMKELGVSWASATDLIAYTPVHIEPALHAEVIPKIGPAVANGIRWFPGQAPVGGGGLEMSTYGIIQDFRIMVE